MTDHAVRLLRRDELRAARDLFLLALHRPRTSDDVWSLTERSLVPGRVFGAAEGSDLIGTAMSFPTRTRVPGGAALCTAAVTMVGVRADRTRRGALTALMRAQLDAFAEAGEALALLHASEGGIYRRYGYGVASRSCTRVLDRRAAEMSAELPSAGPVRLLEETEGLDRSREIYPRVAGNRAGLIDRPEQWWSMVRARRQQPNATLITALHGEPGAEDGYAGYEVEREPGGRGVLRVYDLRAGTDAAYRDLWRLLLSVDLVDEVRLGASAVDEPVELLLTDRRACKLTEVGDELWLRLVDVPEALARRTYGAADPVIIEVRDPLLPANSGRYRITVDGARRVGGEPDLRCDVAGLGALYLGDVPASALARAGVIEVVEPAAVGRADTLFVTATAPWCGTMF